MGKVWVENYQKNFHMIYEQPRTINYNIHIIASIGYFIDYNNSEMKIL